MSNYTKCNNNDTDFGLKNEKKVFKKLKKKYKDVKQFKNPYYPLDFISKKHKIVFECKSTFNQNQDSYCFGHDKYSHFKREYLKGGYSFMLIYFIGGIIVIKKIRNPAKNHTIKEWARTDRGKTECLKKYIHVQRDSFKIFKYQYRAVPSDFLEYKNDVSFDRCMIE